MPKSSEDLVRIMASCGEKVAAIRTSLVRSAIYPSRGEAIQIVSDHENLLIELALEARGLANSYRNFDVGTVAVGLRSNKFIARSSNAWEIRFAANTKEEDGEKYCGEQRLMDAALRKRWSHILGFVVAGEPQSDHGSNRKGITLTPCEACRWRIRGLMREQESIIGPDTLVISVNCNMPWARKYQTVADLHVFHCEPLDVT